MAKGDKKARAAAREAQTSTAATTRKRSYEAAASSRQGESWLSTGRRSADAEIFGEALTLRDRSRALVRNNPFAARVIAEPKSGKSLLKLQ